MHKNIGGKGVLKLSKAEGKRVSSRHNQNHRLISFITFFDHVIQIVIS